MAGLHQPEALRSVLTLVGLIRFVDDFWFVLFSENGSCLARGYKVDMQAPPATRARHPLTRMIRLSTPVTIREQPQGLGVTSYNYNLGNIPFTALAEF